MSALGRQIKIIFVLSRRRYETMVNLAQEFEVSYRTIRRDIDILCEAGIPLRTVSGNGGGIYAVDGWNFGMNILSESDNDFMKDLLPDIPNEKHERFISILNSISLSNLK